MELRLAARRSVEAAERRLKQVERLAQVMQASLLPPALPTIEYLDLAARFRPSSRYEVGGDFYDVFPIDDRAWGVVIGDVCGKGPEAAARTSSARYSLRAAAIQEPTASTVLRVVNQALLGDSDSSPVERFVTALFARLAPTPAGTTVTFSSGGHPLPLVLSATGDVHPVGKEGTLLGVFRDVEVFDATVELAPGDMLVFYTDGVLDSGAPPLHQEGLETLLRNCRNLPVGVVVQRIHDVVAGDQRDDVAILAIAAKE
jgi:sigma-B regulation protein RsbU (phosphoserine phosphatase)